MQLLACTLHVNSRHLRAQLEVAGKEAEPACKASALRADMPCNALVLRLLVRDMCR